MRPSFSGTFLQVEPGPLSLSPWRAKCTTFGHACYRDSERSLLAKCLTGFLRGLVYTSILSLAAVVCLTQEGLVAMTLDALNAAPGQG
jgi:hypothetical protein